MEADPIFRLADCFPLGHPFGQVEVSDEPPSDPRTRPFGLRYLTPPPLGSVTVVPTGRITYDHQAQVALLDGEPLHAQKRTNGRTESPTGPSPDGDPASPPDKEVDTEPD